jgi:hypothetical protein
MQPFFQQVRTGGDTQRRRSCNAPYVNFHRRRGDPQLEQLAQLEHSWRVIGNYICIATVKTSTFKRRHHHDNNDEEEEPVDDLMVAAQYAFAVPTTVNERIIIHIVTNCDSLIC